MLEYTSASVHSICTSSALPSDLLRRSSAVVIEQAQCDVQYSTNHVYIHRPNAFGVWQPRLHLCFLID